MENELNNKTNFFENLIPIIKKNKNIIILAIITIIVIWSLVLFLIYHQENKNKIISEKYITANIYLSNKDKDKSLLLKLEHAIAPYVAFGIMPLFAFANAGVSLDGISLSSLLNPVPLGILCGLFFGKQIGVFLFAYISIKLNFAQKPNNTNWVALYAVSVLTGIGFTMSLFVGNLAFANSPMYLDGVKIGVLSGSLLSTLVGYFLLTYSTKK